MMFLDSGACSIPGRVLLKKMLHILRIGLFVLSEMQYRLHIVTHAEVHVVPWYYVHFSMSNYREPIVPYM